MPSTLSLDTSQCLVDAIGAGHGLQPAEIRRAEAPLSALIQAVERERAAGKHRYRDLPDDRAMLKAVESAVKRWRPGVENLVILGIGGSALGNTALQTALNPPYWNLLPASKRKGPRLFVMDNVDPVQLAAALDLWQPALRKTVFNVISKSGETAETAAQFLVIRDLIAKKLGSKQLAKRIVVTTDAQSGTLRQQAERDGYDTLPVPDGVGGRFSVLSAVGLFSAGMCGIDVRGLLSGARDMSRAAASSRVGDNPAARLALLLNAFYARGKRMHVLFPYSQQLRDLADWYCQLWGESLGKCKDLEGRDVVVGPTPIRALGATDQHSQVQLYREGPNDKVFVFLEVDKFDREVKIPRSKTSPEPSRYLEGATLGKLLNAEKRATELALSASHRPSMTIRLPRVDAYAVGQFIMLWEAATTLMGRLLNIDPYDQPAVQLGKDYTYALMGKKGYESTRKQLEARTKPVRSGGKARA